MDMYEGAKSCVRTPVENTEYFPIEVGLHQGSALSPFLFALILDELSRGIQENIPWSLIFADDIVLVADSKDELNRRLEQWREALEQSGLRISRQKTEYLRCDFNSVENEQNVGVNISIGDQILHPQDSFRYLGSVLHKLGRIDEDVTHRIKVYNDERLWMTLYVSTYTDVDMFLHVPTKAISLPWSREGDDFLQWVSTHGKLCLRTIVLTSCLEVLVRLLNVLLEFESKMLDFLVAFGLVNYTCTQNQHYRTQYHFELAFFQPDNSENRYLGIWYKQISVRTPVWVANRNHPLPGLSPVVLKIVDPGILGIFNNNTMIWSSNTTMTSPNATAKLHDIGNLVLMDEQEKMMWQSFDYPTDTLLSHMKLGKDYSRGIEWGLSSWRSSQDPAPGEFTLRIDLDGYPDDKLKQGALVKFRGEPWRNLQIDGYSKYDKNLTLIYSVVITEKEKSFMFLVENTSLISRLTLDSSGELQNWVWAEDSKNWIFSLKFPIDMCDTYNVCGAYGTCNVGPMQQTCACMDNKKFVPRNQKNWDQADWSGGCVRRTPLDCKNGSDDFIKYSNLKLPDTEGTWFNMSMTSEECKAKCLRNCTCMAYALPDYTLGGKGCVLWFNDLIDMRQYPTDGRDIFVRVASSELGKIALSTSKKKDGTPIKLISSVVVPGVLLIGFISIWLWYVRRKKNNEQSVEEVPLFSFSTIATATASFSTDNILGEGGFGVVYKGVLEDGLEIAIKRLCSTSNQGVNEFKNEVICISRLQHRNLVKLLGCCIKGDERLLIYEYMPNKSLDSFIFGENQKVHLDWPKRFNIIEGIARGLMYLHHDSRLRIIHRDLKAGNILLDHDMNPKISDFGLARSFGGNETQANTKRVVGTHGYMSPEYVNNGLFSIKSDVYSFGVLVLEIVSGKRNRGFNHPEHGNTLTGHAWSVYNEGRSIELIDPGLAESCHPDEVVRSVAIGLLCVQQNAADRPNMSSVVRMLDNEGALMTPKQPAFFSGSDLLVANHSSSSTNQAGSINGLTITHLEPR
ncbi:G-type lectin S-receptor-like serine/threonine-protein kinase At4g27290 [Rutidosis leptorrhynchoides]|uniref:G-type lectin S-receptor-like serine/threonine-protein kinase At4g27290 n=1 Tax=Rutidosis leptorrhynchoides TaxID=125765 RepID=UPI003A996ED5